MSSDLRELMEAAAARGAAWRDADADGPVTAAALQVTAARHALGTLADEPVPAAVAVELVAACEPLLVRTTGPRYFGFVIGGSVDAAVAADILATGWDQCAFNGALSPAAALVEDVAGRWLVDLLGLPAGSSFGFVTGGQGPTPSGSPPDATGCWRPPGGTSSAAACRVRPGSG
jgi:hypothetical protein